MLKHVLLTLKIKKENRNRTEKVKIAGQDGST